MPGGHSKVGIALKAADQARKIIQTLTEVGIVSHFFMNTDEGAEMHGEEEFVDFVYELFEKNNAVELAKTIKMRGNHLNHTNTRNLKIKVGFPVYRVIQFMQFILQSFSHTAIVHGIICRPSLYKFSQNYRNYKRHSSPISLLRPFPLPR